MIKIALIFYIFIFQLFQTDIQKAVQWKVCETATPDNLFEKNGLVRFAGNKAVFTGSQTKIEAEIIISVDRLLLKSGQTKRLFKKTITGDSVIVLDELYVKTPQVVKLHRINK